VSVYRVPQVSQRVMAASRDREQEHLTIIMIYTPGAFRCRLRIIGWISFKGKFMDKNVPGMEVGTKCGHPCIRLDGRIKNDFGCCICMGETQLCTSCEERRHLEAENIKAKERRWIDGVRLE
jgi:hypothetical protein